MGKERIKCNDPSYIGKKYGRLTVIGFRHLNNKSHHGWGWDCKCDCGNIVLGKRPNMVKSGEVLSCGCLKSDWDKTNLGKHNKTHGKSNTRLYGIWEKMKDRCNREKNPAYKNYGGRGIKICDEWNDFDFFYDWSVSHGYNDDLTIERIDVDGNYSPENCCWITRKEQAKNKRNNRYVMVDGEKLPLKTACEKLGIPYKAVHLRVTRYGMSIEDAINTPFKDVSQSLRKKCKEKNMPYSTVSARIRSGWDEYRALETPIMVKKRHNV